MAATHVISKSERNFQNRIPTELEINFCIPRFVVIYWITSNIQIFKIPLYKKVMTILIPGIQPKDVLQVRIQYFSWMFELSSLRWVKTYSKKINIFS